MRMLLAALLLAAAPFLAPALAPKQANAAPDYRAIAERAAGLHIAPAYERLVEATAALEAPAGDCDAEALRVGFHAAYDAWMGAQHIAFGPVEADSHRFAIAFWPDTRGFVDKSLDRLIAARDPVVGDAEGFAKVSVAARGLTALETLLFDEDHGADFSGEEGAYRCRLVQAIARDLAHTSAAVLEGWRGDRGYSWVMASAGAPENRVYLAPKEPIRALFTSMDGALRTIEDLRLGRPLGSEDRPRPRRAETWRSGRSLRNIELSIAALRDLYDKAFAGAVPQAEGEEIEAGFDHAARLAAEAPRPLLEAVAAPEKRAAIEALRKGVHRLNETLRKRLAPAMDVTLGFNAQDGD